jgi:hypothetical protein
MGSVGIAVRVLVCLGPAIAAGCRTPTPDPAPPAAAARPPQPVRVDYADTDAFDLLLETSLVNKHPVVVVQTGYEKPEWGPRLNEWVAAWNAGRPSSGLRARGQIPGVVVDGESIREFRLLVDDLMGRAEESARAGGHWWAERHMRDRRVALLRPYSLRFHLGPDGRIQLIFFHGDYAAQHKAVVRAVADPAGEETLDWFPGYCCSVARVRATGAAGGE